MDDNTLIEMGMQMLAALRNLDRCVQQIAPRVLNIERRLDSFNVPEAERDPILRKLLEIE